MTQSTNVHTYIIYSSIVYTLSFKLKTIADHLLVWHLLVVLIKHDKSKIILNILINKYNLQHSRLMIFAKKNLITKLTFV